MKQNKVYFLKMLNIYNVKSITVNGNTINKVATFYNEKQTNKDKTAVTLKAAEELVAAKIPEIPSESKDLFRKLLDNMNSNTMSFTSTYDESTSTTTYTEDVHGFPITLAGSEFSFISSEEAPLKTDHKTIFIGYEAYDVDNLSESFTIKTKDMTTYIHTDNENIDFYFGEGVKTDFYLSSDFASNSTINVYCNNVNEIHIPSEKYTHSKLYTTGDYSSMGMRNSLTVSSNFEEIHLSYRFFKFESIDNASASEYGDWKDYEGTIYVDRDGINTTLTNEDNIVAKLKTIFNTTTGVVLEN